MGKERITAIALLVVMLVFCIAHLVLAPSQMPHRWVFIILFIGFALFMAFAKRD